ncbi:hypothetical protein ID866_2105 [Astraeus odoratus]|nr:hypothetical protein ID866_2105 [Astraeus odoratus]
MLLTQSPVPLNMSPSTSHRRHPSAPPAVVVQPTKVPGILSISKPNRPSSRQLQSHPRQHRSPKPKLPASKTQPLQRTADDLKPIPQPKQGPVGAATLPSTEKRTAHPATPSPDKSARGRQSKAPKDKAPSSNTSSHVRGRRNNARQPSPPLPSSQVEGTAFGPSQPFAYPFKKPTSNSFDPFLVSSDSDSDNPRAATKSLPPYNHSPTIPSLAPPPSGKLARRRHHMAQPPSTPTPTSRAVLVPRSNMQYSRPSLSRSAPNTSSVSLYQNRRSSIGSSAEFPICDDTTDVEDASLPTTPIRENTWEQMGFDGPRTAPLSTSEAFPFNDVMGATPSPVSRHRRTPSEGVFHMSFDEDMPHSDASEELKKLFGLPPKRFASVGPSLSRAGKDKSGFFASSMFQNSPSPDELPPPAF